MSLQAFRSRCFASQIVNLYRICSVPAHLPKPQDMFAQHKMCLHCTAVRNIKEIIKTKEENITTVEANYLETKAALPMENPHKRCPTCPYHLNMDIKYTDVLVLSQFVRPDGCLLPRYVTGLCRKGQWRMERLLHMAQRAGLMPELRPDTYTGKERTSLKSTYKWKKYNAYFEEDA